MKDRLHVAPLTSVIGAKIENVDLSEPLSSSMLEAIKDAWMKHHVLYFRDQNLNLDQYKRFVKQFGDLHIHSYMQPMKDQGHPEIFRVYSDKNNGHLSLRWHTDETYQERPPNAGFLRAIEVPEVGGDTLFSSMIAAYDALSSSMKRLLADLKAFNQDFLIASWKETESIRTLQGYSHPVVRTHPVTRRNGLFVNSAYTKRIEGIPERESNEILSFLFQHIASPEFTCRFRWKERSIVMWDNRCTQHRAVGDNPAATRHLERLTLVGDVPFYAA